MRASKNLNFAFFNEEKTVTNNLSFSGFIQQCSAGIFHILPIGTIVLQKIEKIIREELNKINSMEVMMPILQPKTLWVRGNRANGYDDETMRVFDRHNKEFFLAPTAEEAALEIIEKFIHSYKQLPISIYQIGKKYRDDLRPRFGMIRCREFIMKDAYSFDVNKEGALQAFLNMYNSYIKIFNRMGLKVIPVKADTGLIGGDLSYELVVLSEFGENTVYYNHNNYGTMESINELANSAASFTESDTFTKSSKCIELGHIYYLGTKYSEAMNSKFADKNDEKLPYEMGCYGIGVSRILGVIKQDIYLNYNISPFKIYLIGDNNSSNNNLYRELKNKYMDQNFIHSVYFDDRNKSFGFKKTSAKELGIPITVIAGKTLQVTYRDQINEIQPDDLHTIIDKYIELWKKDSNTLYNKLNSQ